MSYYDLQGYRHVWRIASWAFLRLERRSMSVDLEFRRSGSVIQSRSACPTFSRAMPTVTTYHIPWWSLFTKPLFELASRIWLTISLTTIDLSVRVIARPYLVRFIATITRKRRLPTWSKLIFPLPQICWKTSHHCKVSEMLNSEIGSSK